MGSPRAEHSQAEREPKNDPRLSGPVVALLRELLQEVVAPCDADFSEGEFGECGGNEGTHVALIEQPRGAGEPVFNFHVFEPVVHECGEPAVGTEPDEARLEEGAFGEFPLQGEFSCGLGGTSALGGTELPVPVAVTSSCFAPSCSGLAMTDLSESTNRSAGPSHAEPPFECPPTEVCFRLFPYAIVSCASA